MADPEVMTPGDILADDLREELKKAAIAGYMATSVIGDTDGDHSIKSFVNMEWHDDEVRFNYRASILGEDYPVYCMWPSGDWKLDVSFLPDVGDYPGFTAIDVSGGWDNVRSTVDEWLDPWVNSCPDPNGYTNQINSVARIASQLNIGGGGSESGPAGGDTDLREAVKTIDNRSTDGNSRAIVAFRDAYVSDLWTTIFNQCGATASAGLALTAEGVAWSETYRSVRDLIMVAINDFKTLAKANETNDDAALTAVGAVAGILGATVGVAFPPFGVAMGGLSAVIGVYTVMNPAVAGEDAKPLELSGSDYFAMMESFQEQMREVARAHGRAEQNISAGCNAVLTDMDANPESYFLSRKTSRGRQYDDFEGTLVTEIDVPKNLLQEMAGAAELIGNQQQELASILAGSDAAGSSSANVQFEWYRGSLPDGTAIGLGSGGYGPYDDYMKLVDAVAGMLKDEGKNSHRMAEALMATALDYSLTDDRSGADSQHIQSQIDVYESQMDHNPVVRGNDPNDPWYEEVK